MVTSLVQGFFFFFPLFQDELLAEAIPGSIWFLANALRGRVGSQSKTFMEHLLDLYGVYILESQSPCQHWGFKSEYEALRNSIQLLFTDEEALAL